MRDFFNYTRKDLKNYLSEVSEPTVHAVSMFKRVYKFAPDPPWKAQTISLRLSNIMKKEFSIAPLEIVQFQESLMDSTIKFVFNLVDDNQIETVLMPEIDRITLCISSQVGCRQACSFCQTSHMGLVRNLTAGEIINQIYTVKSWLEINTDWVIKNKYEIGSTVSNIVFMGMGEPMDNVKEVIRAIDVITDGNGFAIAQKRVSVSTSGHVDGLLTLHKSFPRIPIALSLLNPFNEERSKLMPINKKWPLTKVIETLIHIQKDNNKFVFIQYPMIKDYNDTKAHAIKLAEILASLNARVNIIQYNPIFDATFETASSDNIQLFCDILFESGYMVTVRKSNGQDISAGCGQLIQRK